MESPLLKLPYSESALLSYVDSQELPPFLLDLLEQLTVDLFYQGCIIAEIRDYRRRSSSSNGATTGKASSSGGGASTNPETSHILLRPSNLSIICDSQNLSAANRHHNLLVNGIQNNGSGAAATTPTKGGAGGPLPASDSERTSLEGELLLQTQVGENVKFKFNSKLS